MPKLKGKKAKGDIFDDQEIPISTYNQNPLNDDDERYRPTVSRSKGKKKHKKNRIDSPNKDRSPKKSNLDPVEEQEKEKKRKDKVKEKDKVEEKEANEACYLPGQKHERPHERDPLRIFFDVLYQQLPDSELAETWMMEWGLLPPEEATEIYGKQLKKNQQEELGSPAEAVSLKTTSKVSCGKEDNVSQNPLAKSKKRKVSDNNSEDDFMSKKNKKKKKEQKVCSS